MTMRMKYTPYAALKDGDQFVRIASQPILLRDLPGTRDGANFILSGLSYPPLRIMLMKRMPAGWLKEVYLVEESPDEDSDPDKCPMAVDGKHSWPGCEVKDDSDFKRAAACVYCGLNFGEYACKSVMKEIS